MFRLLFSGLIPAFFLVSLPAFSISFPHSGLQSGIYSSQSELWWLYSNPAGIYGIKSLTGGTFYRSQFSLKELAVSGAALAIPVKRKVIAGLGYRKYGYKHYKQQEIGLALARSFSDRIHAGLSIDLNTLYISGNYGRSLAMTARAGVILDLTDHVRVGLSIDNPGRSKISKRSDVKYPVLLNTNLELKFGNHTTLQFEVEKSLNLEPVYSTGIMYRISEKFLLLTGFSNSSDAFYFGYSFNAGHYSIGMFSGYQHYLGFSPAICITFKK